MPRAPHVTLSLPQALLDAYHRHEGPLGLPHLSELCATAMAARLREAGATVPDLPPPDPRTAAATAARIPRAATERARIQRRRDRRAEPGT